MSQLGDIIPELSTTTALGATGMFLSPGIIISEYNSLSFIMKSDIDTIVQLQWSSDGVNYYYTQNFPFLATISDNGVSSIASKWVRVLITNKQAVAGSTYMNFEMYGSPGSNAVTAIIKGITANILAEIDVKNSFVYSSTGELLTESFVPDQQYNFNNSRVNIDAGFPLSTSYNNVFGTYVNASSRQWQVSNGCIELIDWGGVTGGTTGYSPDNSAQTMIYSTQFTKWMPGYSTSCIFSAAYNSGVYQNNSINATNTLLVGMANMTNTYTPYEGVFMGFTGVTGGVTGSGIQANTNTVFGIHIYRFGSLTFIPQTAWADPCNGDFKMPNNMSWKNMNTFKLQILPQGDLNVFILNPSSGVFNLVYYRSFVNSGDQSATFQNPSFGLVALFKSTAGSKQPVSDYIGNGLYLSSWMIGFENSFPNYNIDRYNPLMYVGVSPPADLNPILNKNDAVCYTLSNSPTLNGYNNFTTLYLDNFYVSMLGNTNVGLVSLYKNPNFIILGGATGYLIDPTNSPAYLYGKYGLTGTANKLPTISGTGSISSSPTGTNVPLFSTILSNSISNTKAGGFVTGQEIDISSYNIKLYPGDFVSLLLTSNVSLQNNVKTYASIGFHQLH